MKFFIKLKLLTLSILVVTATQPEASSFQPEFAESIANISVVKGRDATFTCYVKHLGGYKVGWVRKDTQTILAINDHVITYNARVRATQDVDENTWNLHIKAVKEEDAGEYWCQINTDPMKIQTGYLNVLVPPEFIREETSGDVDLLEGSSLGLPCRARGNPEPVIMWKREDGTEIILKDSMGSKTPVTTFQNEVLNFTNIARNEMGTYLCIASNTVPPSASHRILVSVHIPPVIHVPNQEIGASLGTDVEIECHVEAFPKSTNYWIKDTGEPIVSSLKYNVQEYSKSLYEMKMILTVKNLEKEDAGNYRCIVKNTRGEAESSIRLSEIQGSTQKTSQLSNYYYVYESYADSDDFDDEDMTVPTFINEYTDEDSRASHHLTLHRTLLLLSIILLCQL